MSARLVPALTGSKLIVFDKDGTLTHCDKCYGPWLESVAVKLQALGYINDAPAFFQSLDYNPITKIFGVTASVVHGTPHDVMVDCAKEAFKQVAIADISYDVFREGFLEQCASGPEGNIWQVDARFLTVETLELCGTRMLELFGLLREAGVKVAICTSDVRYVTAQTMRAVKLDQFLNIVEKDGVVEDDMACSGSDSDIAPKPLPAGILKLVRLRGVSPEQTVMVGDSFGDMIAGLRAGCTKLVFVESGGHTAAELLAYIGSPEFRAIAETNGFGEVDVTSDTSKDETMVGLRKIYVMSSIDGMLC